MESGIIQGWEGPHQEGSGCPWESIMEKLAAYLEQKEKQSAEQKNLKGKLPNDLKISNPLLPQKHKASY